MNVYETSRTRKLFLRWASVISVLILSVLASAGIAEAATTSCKPVIGMKFAGGKGHPADVYAYNWNCSGKLGFCIDFGLHNPDGNGSSQLLQIAPSMTAEETKQAEWISYNYAHSTSKLDVAVAAFATWKLRNDSDFQVYFPWARSHGVINDAFNKRINDMITASKFHGPYKVAVKISAVHVGQIGAGSAVITAANNKPAPGVSVNLASTTSMKVISVNGITGVRGKTNSRGAITYKFIRTNVGAATVYVNITASAYAKAMITSPSRGRQHVLIGYAYTARGSARFDKILGKPAMVSTCDTNCDGLATVTFSAANSANSKMVLWTWRDEASAPVASLYVSGGTTGSTSAQLFDGTNITNGEYCYVNVKGGACVTPTIKLPGMQEVVCPGWVRISSTVDCPCEGGVSFKFTLTAPTVGNRSDQAIVLKNGLAVQTLDLVNGVPATTNPVLLGTGDRVQVKFISFREVSHTNELRSGTLFDMSNNL